MQGASKTVVMLYIQGAITHCKVESLLTWDGILACISICAALLNGSPAGVRGHRSHGSQLRLLSWHACLRRPTSKDTCACLRDVIKG